ncbi:MAG: DUF87 domain-containing protein [Lachnospiraceae bacterium]|nr:DUF87 domain-containing protein [Lachnospiraceae bacterium]
MRFEEMQDDKLKDSTPVPHEPKIAAQAVVANDPRPYKEPEPEKMNLSILQSNLGNCLNIIDDEVMKGYVTRLDQLPIIRLDEGYEKDLNEIHFFKISELVYQEDEFSVDKLAMVFHALSNKSCTLVLMLRSNGEQTDFYLGARPDGANSAGTLFQMLKQSLIGFFPGSKISEYYDENMRQDMQRMNIGCVSSVTCVADYKQDAEKITNKEFIQGLEKFVYAMHGKSYTAIFIADNVSHDELMARKREYEQIYTQISPFANIQMNFTVSDGGTTSVGSSEGKTTTKSHTDMEGKSLTETDTKTHMVGSAETIGKTDTETDTHTVTDSVSDGKTHTVGTADGTSNTVTNGVNVGTYAGVSTHAGIKIGPFNVGGGKNVGMTAGVSHSVAKGTSHTDSVSDSISKTLTHGSSDSHGHSHSDSRSIAQSESDSASKSIGVGTTTSAADTFGEAFNLVNTKTMTDSFGTSKGVTLNAQNMTLSFAMQRIEKHLERIEECESFGMWNFAAYFLGETAAETETAANTYKSVIAGNDSGIERSAINSWSDDESLDCLNPYLTNFLHPRFVYTGFSYDTDRYIAVDPSALVSTNELAIHMGLPRHSVRGLPVIEHATFAQEVIKRKQDGVNAINLGKVYHLGQETDTDVELDVNSLAMHTFITGSTGSGKSNAVYHLISEARRKGIPFLVVEPAKGEYKDVFTDVKCYGTNPKMGDILKINPFSFPDGIHVLEHIDRIVEIFNVCWPMYAAMPAVLKESVEQAYVSAGWDLDLSENVKVPGLFPTFDDVLRELNTTIKASDYSADTKGDYIGSLSTRLKSLTNGINGRIFVSDEMALHDLLDKDAIIDISRVGAMETKSLIMGLVVLKLQEYRMANAGNMNVPLKHLTILEEAHNLLKKTSTEQSAEGSNMIGKSVEMLTNAIAEIRTYGEGFIIVDQAPNLLDTAAIRNTNTKIVLRLPESTDRQITGGAMALNNQQFDELSKLPTGVAAVYQNDWQEAVLCSLPKYESFDYQLRKEKHTGFIEIRKAKSSELLHMLIKKELTEEEQADVIERIKVSNVSAKVRKDMILNIGKWNRVYEWAVADFINKNYEFSDVFRGTSKCANLEELSHIMYQNIEDEFADFDKNEIYTIMYYVCRIEHEKHPENAAIEALRTSYLKSKVM